MADQVVFIQGGGLGLAQERAVRTLLAQAGIDTSRWLVFPAGAHALEQGLDPMPEAMLNAIRQGGLALKTKLLNPKEGTHANFNVLLRQKLGLFAAVRPIRNLRGLPARFDNVNILLLREITEDLYTSIEHVIVPGVVESIKVVTEAACRRFFHFVFETARAEGRRTVHCIHKANILKLADGLMLQCFQEIAKQYPDLEAKEMIVDNCFMQLVARPHQFDVLATGNLYGDMISDLGSGLVGGITHAIGINHGQGIRVYECIHGGPLEAAPADRVDPLPLLFCVLAMLRAAGQDEPAQRLQTAVEDVLEEGHRQTPDFCRRASTDQLISLISGKLKSSSRP